MIPDLKDLLIVFGSTARWNPRLARRNLKLAWETGIVITGEMVEVVLVNSIAYLRKEDGGSTNEIKEILSLGKSLGLDSESLHSLKEITDSLLVGRKKGHGNSEWNISDAQLWSMSQRTHLNETRPSVLYSLIRKAAKDDAWRSIITLFRRGVVARIIDERLITLTLSGLLSSYRRTERTSSTKRTSLHLAFKEIIDLALSTTPPLSPLSGRMNSIPIMRKETFEIILRCCLKLGDLGAIESVRKRMEESGFSVGVEIERAVRSLEVQQRITMEGDSSEVL